MLAERERERKYEDLSDSHTREKEHGRPERERNYNTDGQKHKRGVPKENKRIAVEGQRERGYEKQSKNHTREKEQGGAGRERFSYNDGDATGQEHKGKGENQEHANEKGEKTGAVTGKGTTGREEVGARRGIKRDGQARGKGGNKE